jgi:cytochrome c553
MSFHDSAFGQALRLGAVWTSLLAAGAVGAAPAQQAAPAVREAQRAHMQVHFQEALTVHDAVTRGDLAAAKPVAMWLATHEPPKFLPPSTSAFVDAMQGSARQAALATTVLDAAMASAAMLKACGDCHRAAGTMPATPITRRPELGGVVGHMLEHQTAADQLAAGLIVPSSADWRRGAEGLMKAPLRRNSLPPGTKLPDSLLASEARIHELAGQALRTEDAAARAVFYGQILARCADCHAQHRTIWGPGPR